MNLFEGVVGSIIASVLVAIVVTFYRAQFGQRIEITDPATHDDLAPAELQAGVQAHPVHGRVKHVPRGHRVWLVVANESEGKFWPQGFSPVALNEANGIWKGYIHVWGWHHITIVAVIAPPTTQDFFNYFQHVGPKTEYAPLSEIPPECKWRATVQAKVPELSSKLG